MSALSERVVENLSSHSTAMMRSVQLSGGENAQRRSSVPELFGDRAKRTMLLKPVHGSS